MTVEKLIELLKSYPKDAKVRKLDLTLYALDEGETIIYSIQLDKSKMQ